MLRPQRKRMRNSKGDPRNVFRKRRRFVRTARPLEKEDGVAGDLPRPQAHREIDACRRVRPAVRRPFSRNRRRGSSQGNDERRPAAGVLATTGRPVRPAAGRSGAKLVRSVSEVGRSAGPPEDHRPSRRNLVDGAVRSGLSRRTQNRLGRARPWSWCCAGACRRGSSRTS